MEVTEVTDGGTCMVPGDLQDAAGAPAAAERHEVQEWERERAERPPKDAAGAPAAAEGREVQERERERAERPPKEGGRRGKGRARDGRDEEKPDRRAPAAGAGAGGSSCSGGRAEEAGGRAGGGYGASGGEGGTTGGGKDGALELPQTGIYTTVMLRNIPNKYTREMLVKQLSVDFNGLFDFMYLPIDFKNKCNVGYGFINFRTAEACDRFIKAFHGVDVRKCLPGLNSKKVVEVTPARVQGLAENVRRLRNSPVMNQLVDHPEWMPLFFNASGIEEPFPMPDQPLPPVKPRGRNREAANRDSG